jgi:hypothetical protein
VKRTIKLLFAAALLVAAALLPAASAAAHSGDRNRDRIPDRWEKRHHLSLKVKQTHRDQDRDGLNNLGEFRSHSDPRDADSDEDGIEDGKEDAGKISAFDGATLTITLFAGGDVTGKVTPDTEIECRTAAETERGERGDDDKGDGERAHDASDDPGDDGEQGDGEHGDDHGDQGDGDHEQDEPGEDDHADCPPDALKVGATVHEAELRATGDGALWRQVELIIG